MGRIILETENLNAGYRKKALLTNVSMAVESGQIVTLIGPNGAGKTTLLKTLAGLLEPVSGKISLCGKDLAAAGPRWAAAHLSVVLTRPPDPELMSVFEVAGAGRHPYTGLFGTLSDKDREKIMEALDQTGTAHLAGEPFSTLSDGQKQRVMLARAICQEPEIMILDEPASFLDIRHKLALFRTLTSLVRTQGLAVVMSLHELGMAMKISDRIVCIRNGGIDRAGTPEEILTDEYIRQLYDLETDDFLEGSWRS